MNTRFGRAIPAALLEEPRRQADVGDREARSGAAGPSGMSETAVFNLCAGAGEFMAALSDDLERCHTSLWVQFSTFEGTRAAKRSPS